MRAFYTLLIFGIAFQCASYLLWAFDVDPQMSYPLGNVSNISSVFSLTPFSLAFTATGAVAIGLASLLLRAGTYAYYAVLVWVIGTMVPIVQTFFLAIPNTIGAFIPASANPNPAVFPINPLMIVVGAIFAVAAFFFLVELAAQRNIT